MNRNHTDTRNGKAAAICQICNKQSRPVKANSRGEPDLLALASGWSQTPFPPDYVHENDGSVGSLHTCPCCNKRLNRGETLTLRGK